MAELHGEHRHLIVPYEHATLADEHFTAHNEALDRAGRAGWEVVGFTAAPPRRLLGGWRPSGPRVWAATGH